MVLPSSRQINSDEMADLEEVLKKFDFDNRLLLERYRGGSELRERYFDLIDNYVIYSPKMQPYNAQITCKLGSRHKPYQILKEVCDSFD